MKQIYTVFNQNLCRVLVVMLLSFVGVTSINAQQRKSWDFRKGLSEETIANLNADKTRWGSNGTDSSTGATNNWKNLVKMTGELTANDVVIPETQGLNFTITAKSDNSIHLATNKIRLTRDKDKIIVPKLVGGQTITIIARSANGTATDRGFNFGDNMEWVSGPADAICKGPDGDQELVWRVKDSVTDSTDITITMVTGGVDISLIMVDEGDGPDIEEAKKVAFVGGADDMMLMALQSAPDRIDATLVDATSDFTVADLQEYDAVVVSPAVAADAKAVPVLKSAIAYQPMVNLNAALYEVWGLGSAVASDATSLTLTEAYVGNESFASFAGEGLLADGQFSAVTLGSYFADDAVIANAGDAVAVHMHNDGRNTYIGMPLSVTALPADPTFIVDAVVYAARSKKAVPQAATPVITQKNSNLATEVSIVCSTVNSTVYYTLDGTDPTEASTVYENPFTLTEVKTVKALATADGFLASKVASAEVAIMAQAATPVFTMTKEATSTTVEIASATDGVDIYYSYLPINEEAIIKNLTAANVSNPTVVKGLQKYTAPIVLSSEPTMIYAMASGAGYVNSEIGEEYVAINSLNANTIRMDTIAHFDANQANWLIDNSANGGTGNASAYYYFGKSAWKYFSDEVLGTEGEGENQVTIYKPDPNAKKTLTSETDPDWRLVSSGQVLISQNIAALDYVGNGAGAYAAESAEDMIGGCPTKFDIQFANKTAGDPYTGAIESTKKFPAPFDVVTYIASGNKEANTVMELQISTDGENWEKVSNLNISALQRYYRKSRVSVEKTGDYYVRVAHISGTEKPMVFDIYVLNNGEISKKYDPSAGIEDIASESAEVISVEIYNLNGIRLAEPATGVNIIRTVYSDGTVKTEKVLNR